MHESELVIDSGGLFSHLVGDNCNAGGQTPSSLLAANITKHKFLGQERLYKQLSLQWTKDSFWVEFEVCLWWFVLFMDMILGSGQENQVSMWSFGGFFLQTMCFSFSLSWKVGFQLASLNQRPFISSICARSGAKGQICSIFSFRFESNVDRDLTHWVANTPYNLKWRKV